MTRALIAAFPAAEPLLAAARAARDRGRPACDAFTPYPVEGLPEALAVGPSGLPWVMLAAGVVVAGALYALELYSASVAYPFEVGARPLNSWAAFLVAPAEFGVLAAALGGFLMLLVRTRLPRLHHPLFDHLAFERASQDQFILAYPTPEPDDVGLARQTAFEAGAVWVEETEL